MPDVIKGFLNKILQRSDCASINRKQIQRAKELIEIKLKTIGSSKSNEISKTQKFTVKLNIKVQLKLIESKNSNKLIRLICA